MTKSKLAVDMPFDSLTKASLPLRPLSTGFQELGEPLAPGVLDVTPKLIRALSKPGKWFDLDRRIVEDLFAAGVLRKTTSVEKWAFLGVAYALERELEYAPIVTPLLAPLVTTLHLNPAVVRLCWDLTALCLISEQLKLFYLFKENFYVENANYEKVAVTSQGKHFCEWLKENYCPSSHRMEEGGMHIPIVSLCYDIYSDIKKLGKRSEMPKGGAQANYEVQKTRELLRSYQNAQGSSHSSLEDKGAESVFNNKASPFDELTAPSVVLSNDSRVGRLQID